MNRFALFALLALNGFTAPARACSGGVFDGYLAAGDALLAGAPETCFQERLEAVAAPEFRVTPLDFDQYLVNSLDARLLSSGMPAETRFKLVSAYAARRLANCTDKVAGARVEFPVAGSPKLVKSAWSDAPEGSIRPNPAFVENLPAAYDLYEKAGDIWRASESVRKTPGVPAGKAVGPAVSLWKKLLELPGADRAELTVPARLMLVKAALACGDHAAAAEAIRDIRDAVRAGAPDPCGLAAATYQLEVHLARNEVERASSLIRVVASGGPRWQQRELVKLLRFWVREADHGTPVDLPADVRCAIAAWVTSQPKWGNPTDPDAETAAMELAWGRFIERTQKDFPEAGLLAISAYRQGEYASAQRWCDRASASDPYAALVAARLLRRDGQPEAAAERLARCLPKEGLFYGRAETARRVLAQPNYFGASWLPFQYIDDGDDSALQCPAIAPGSTVDAPMEHPELFPYALPDSRSGYAMVAAELAVDRLRRAQKPAESLDLFLRCGLWRDAARVMEAHLSTEELLRLLPSLPAPDWKPEHFSESDDDWFKNRLSPRAYVNAVAARRLVREGRFDQARELFPESVRKKLDAYREWVKVGYDFSKPDRERGTALWAAADWTRWHGDCLFLPVTGPRWRGHQWEDVDAEPSATRWDPVIKISRRDRVMRYRAGELAFHAASLMPANDESASSWLAEACRWHLDGDDPEAADFFYKQLCLRHPKTAAGAEALLRRTVPRPKSEDSK